MTNFSGIGRQGLWSWLTPERAVLVVPVLAGLGLSMAVLSVGVTPLTMRVREQSEVVEQLTVKAEFLPVLQQQSEANCCHFHSSCLRKETISSNLWCWTWSSCQETDHEKVIREYSYDDHFRVRVDARRVAT